MDVSYILLFLLILHLVKFQNILSLHFLAFLYIHCYTQSDVYVFLKYFLFHIVLLLYYFLLTNKDMLPHFISGETGSADDRNGHTPDAKQV